MRRQEEQHAIAVVVRRTLAAWAIATLAACSGGVGINEGPEAASASLPLDADEATLAKTAANNANPDTAWQPPAGSTPKNVNYLYLQSGEEDVIGVGRTYLYTQVNALWSLSTSGPSLNIVVRGDESWTGDFQELASFNRLKRGLFIPVERFPSQTETVAGLHWQSQARGCEYIDGWLAVDEVEYDDNRLSAIVLRFAQYCEGATTPLRGKIRWSKGDKSTPPGPVNPPPPTLWQPAPGSTPATGSYFFVQGAPGEPILGDATRLFTQANAKFDVASTDGTTTVHIAGDEVWHGDFKPMDFIKPLVAGYYGNLGRYPFHNPAVGGLNVSGIFRGCSTITGWFAVDAVSFTNGRLTLLDLRFEQFCDGGTVPLHGKIHWDANDPTRPPGPVNPPPAALWQPPAGATPATGNYVYLESDVGDPIAQGRTLLYTNANAFATLATDQANHLTISVAGDARWTGNFVAMYSLARLQPGYYAEPGVYPFFNPARPGMLWLGTTAGCTQLTGSWFTVDSVTYTGDLITAIDLRFEQHCGGQTPALRGKIHWVVGDLTGAPLPVNPPPAGLWDAPAGATPATGNYVYLQSDAGDPVGSGRTDTFTDQNAQLAVVTSGNAALVTVRGALSYNGFFQAMAALATLQPGYYANVGWWPFQNPTAGGLRWTSTSSCSNSIAGWFVIDSVAYSGGNIVAFDARFEERCEGGVPALRGKVHWVAG